MIPATDVTLYTSHFPHTRRLSTRNRDSPAIQIHPQRHALHESRPQRPVPATEIHPQQRFTQFISDKLLVCSRNACVMVHTHRWAVSPTHCNTHTATYTATHTAIHTLQHTLQHTHCNTHQWAVSLVWVQGGKDT